MIPISDNIFFFTSKKPLVTLWLIGINIALFLWEIKLDISNELGEFVKNWGVIPAQISGGVKEVLAGNPAATIVVMMGVGSLIVGMFLHSSFSQILGNLLFLWVFGKTVEKVLGYKRFLGLYLLGGMLTAIVQIFADPNLGVPLIGANGAIASILGAYILKFSNSKIDSILPLIIVFVPVQIPAFYYVFWWFLQQLFYGIGSLNIPGGVNPFSIGYWMHGVGLIIGAVWIRLVQYR
ncbi:MAG: rhomboid family intramembrane serine protease [Nostocaceae cyanobacterium]|nr:rhomboid family intramembrane serine protease [Nostocaceae cyanobacterium]